MDQRRWREAAPNPHRSCRGLLAEAQQRQQRVARDVDDGVQAGAVPDPLKPRPRGARPGPPPVVRELRGAPVDDQLRHNVVRHAAGPAPHRDAQLGCGLLRRVERGPPVLGVVVLVLDVVAISGRETRRAGGGGRAASGGKKGLGVRQVLLPRELRPIVAKQAAQRHVETTRCRQMTTAAGSGGGGVACVGAEGKEQLDVDPHAEDKDRQLVVDGQQFVTST